MAYKPSDQEDPTDTSDNSEQEADPPVTTAGGATQLDAQSGSPQTTAHDGCREMSVVDRNCLKIDVSMDDRTMSVTTGDAMSVCDPNRTIMLDTTDLQVTLRLQNDVTETAEYDSIDKENSGQAEFAVTRAEPANTVTNPAKPALSIRCKQVAIEVRKKNGELAALQNSMSPEALSESFDLRSDEAERNDDDAHRSEESMSTSASSASSESVLLEQLPDARDKSPQIVTNWKDCRRPSDTGAEQPTDNIVCMEQIKEVALGSRVDEIGTPGDASRPRDDAEMMSEASGQQEELHWAGVLLEQLLDARDKSPPVVTNWKDCRGLSDTDAEQPMDHIVCMQQIKEVALGSRVDEIGSPGDASRPTDDAKVMSEASGQQEELHWEDPEGRGVEQTEIESPAETKPHTVTKPAQSHLSSSQSDQNRSTSSSSTGQLTKAADTGISSKPRIMLFRDIYFIEDIVAYKVVNKTLMFRVRWEGFPAEEETWEPVKHLTEFPGNVLLISTFLHSIGELEQAYHYLKEYLCMVILENNCRDPVLLSMLSGQPLDPDDGPLSVAKCRRMQEIVHFKLAAQPGSATRISFINQDFMEFVKTLKERADFLDTLGQWEKVIAEAEGADIAIENNANDNGFPAELSYTAGTTVSSDVAIVSPTHSCACNAPSCSSDECYQIHQQKHKRHRIYTLRRTLSKRWMSPQLFECNKLCTCGPECINRLVQRGIRLSLTIFMTTSGDWRVRANTSIEHGAFVAEYAGELITVGEAEKRGNGCRFRFYLRPDESRPVANVIDATKYGNLSRFFGHSVDPNLIVRYVYIDNHNPDAPHVAFFARRKIHPNEQLTFDHNVGGCMAPGEQPGSKSNSPGARSLD